MNVCVCAYVHLKHWPGSYEMQIESILRPLCASLLLFQPVQCRQNAKCNQMNNTYSGVKKEDFMMKNEQNQHRQERRKEFLYAHEYIMHAINSNSFFITCAKSKPSN